MIIKAFKIAAAEGFLVFVRKTTRWICWEFTNKIVGGIMTYRQGINKKRVQFLVKQLPADGTEPNARELFDLMEDFKEEIITIKQIEKVE